VGLKLNRTHNLLAYADDVNRLVDNIETIKKITETLIDASKEVGTRRENCVYVAILSPELGQNRDIKIANRLFWKYVTVEISRDDEILIQEEIKRGLNSGRACYHSVQNLLSSCMISKNVKIRMYKTLILPVVLYGCETWSLTLRE
jgi:hypothetical protein